jgi:hydrogenase maturation protease
MSVSDSDRNDSAVVIAGFGSPHGDDQFGWQIIAMLQRRRNLPARVVAVCEATQLLWELAGCQRLIIIDACQSNEPIGTVTRMNWPDSRIASRHAHSTHGAGVYESLQLAERLGRLPPSVEVIGVEAETFEPGREMSPILLQMRAEVEKMVLAEIDEVTTA